MVCQIYLTLYTRTHSSGSLWDTDSRRTRTLEVQNIIASLVYATKSEQFFARISGCRASDLSKHDRQVNYIGLKGPNNNDPVIRFDIWNDPDIKDSTIGFM